MATGREFPLGAADYFKQGERNEDMLERSMKQKANADEVAVLDKYIDQLLGWANSTDLVGGIMMYVGSVAPPGYFLCTGGTFVGADYPELRDIVGDKFGVHSGDNYFLPNLKGRVPAGFDVTQSEFDRLGKNGGNKTHTLTIAQMPAHDHGGVTAISAITPLQALAAGGSASSGPYARGTGTNSSQAMSGLDHTHAITSEGGTQPHNNLQPFLALNFIIKAEAAPIDGGSSGPGGPGAVTSVNGKTGDVVLTTDDISEGSNNLYFHEFVHSQASPLASWTVNHNLGKKPEVGVYNTGSKELMAEVVHTSDNQTIISFVAPTAGYARFS